MHATVVQTYQTYQQNILKT